jgi:hypothetical protein
VRAGAGQAFLVIERIDRERVATFTASDEVVEIAIGIASPYLFDDHLGYLLGAVALSSVARVAARQG